MYGGLSILRSNSKDTSMKMSAIVTLLIALFLSATPTQCMNELRKKQTEVAAEGSERAQAFGYAAEPNLNPMLRFNRER